MTQMNMIQDAPYSGFIELLDEAGAIQTLPLGTPRMHVRRIFSNSDPDFDLSAYLVREATRVVIDIPSVMTRVMGGDWVTDVWVGDTRLVQCTLVVDRSATLR